MNNKPLPIRTRVLSIQTVIMALMMALILAACGTTNAPVTKVVLSSPQANAEFLSNVSIQIQGQADGAGIVRVDVIVDSGVMTSVQAPDANNGVASLPVSVPYNSQTIGTHFVQLKVYAAGDKLIAMSDPVIFTIKLSPVTTRLIESGRSLRSSGFTFNLVIGVIFVAWGLQDTERFSFITIVGVCFLAFGGYGFLQARRLAKERQQP